MRTVTATTLGLTVTLLMSACMSMKPAQPEKTVDGLVRIPTKRIDTAYAAPGMTLASYRRVMLDPVHVAFKRNWQRSHPELTAQDLARIRSQAAALFRDVFARELDDKGGYALTDQPGPDVLRVTASIVDLDISAPQAGSQAGTRSYVVSPGEMTLLAELRDSESGAILVRAADHERGRDFGNLQIANEVTNSAEAQRAFAMWAGLLRVALDDARAATPPAR